MSKASEYQSAYHKKHKDKQLAAVKRYQAKNRELVKERNRLWHHEHPAVSMWRRAKQRAKNKRIRFSIRVEDIAIPARCPVLGIPLRTGQRGNPHGPSLDRFDNSKGYVRGNIRVISNRANSLKRDGTLTEFKALVKYLEGK